MGGIERKGRAAYFLIPRCALLVPIRCRRTLAFHLSLPLGIRDQIL